MSILDEGSCVAVEVDRFFRIEQHVLAGINLQDEVFQGTKTYDAGNLPLFFFRHIIKLAQFVTGLTGIGNHGGNQVVCIDNCTFTALHLTVGQFHHTIGEVYQFLTPLKA